jgi:hypothetical protein
VRHVSQVSPRREYLVNLATLNATQSVECLTDLQSPEVFQCMTGPGIITCLRDIQDSVARWSRPSPILIGVINAADL